MIQRKPDLAWIVLTDKHEIDHAQRIVAVAQARGVPVRMVNLYPRTMSDQDAVAGAVGIVLCIHSPRWPQYKSLFAEIVKLPFCLPRHYARFVSQRESQF